MPDIAFVADGFNLYHSVTDASKDLTNQAYQALLATGSLGLMLPVGTRWLDMNSLFASYRANIASGVAFKPGFHTQSVYYFSALAHHMERSSPGTVNRHLSYIQCLEATGVVPKLARFKSKFIRCDLCSGRLERHEEKETDVLVALQLIKLALDQKNPVKAIALVSGDTDYAPALRLVREMNPSVFLA